MDRLRKSFVSFFVLFLLISGLMMVETACAQSAPKPSVPEFTLELINSPPESGLVNRTIELTIKNQPFTPYYDASSGWNISFYYNVQIKTNEDNWSANWTTLYTVDELPAQSNNNYTVFLYPSEQPNDENTYTLGGRMLDLPPETQIEFQVEAMIGNVHRIQTPNALFPYVFTGNESSWSKTQTITIPKASTSASPTPTVPEFPTLILIITLLLTTTLMGTVMIKRKQSTGWMV